MTRLHSRRGNRPAFTLVELMVVVLIIAILVSLVSSAVMMAMEKIPETQTRTDISEMEMALQAMMADFGLDEPPPSVLVLSPTNPLSTTSGKFLTKMFGKNLGAQGPINWGGTSGGGTLTGEQCLVFYLSGINGQGFSSNKMNPSQIIAGQKPHGPYFNFQTSRLVAGNGAPGFLVYIDPWQTKTGANYATLGGSPYVYYSSQGINNSYQNPTFNNGLTNTSGYGAFPYLISGTAQYMNPNTYQIISAGKDGYFGGQTGWVPTNGATGTGADDQTNFSAKLLGAGQQ